jgi:glycosyltransferase involved in cell wall biosynthesis
MNFSVLLSVYKKEKPEYLKRALESIYTEQTLKPTEIVLVEDGKLTDELDEVILDFQKKVGDVLKIVKIERNQGLANALNVGLEYCSYSLVARMDTDDISLPQRFEKQVAYMQKNPNISVCGSFIGEFDDTGEEIKQIVKLPVTHEETLRFVQLRTPIAHPVAMLRKSDIYAVGGYPPFPIGQDIALWSVLLARGYKLANIPEVLLKIRVNDNFYTRRSWEAFKSTIKVSKLQYAEGLINKKTFIRNVIARFFLRMSPVFLRKIAYKLLRK